MQAVDIIILISCIVVSSHLIVCYTLFSSDNNFLSSIQGLKSTLNLTNYDVLSQKGLSTAFTRSFMKHSSANGTLSTIQEMFGGIVKRGLVDVAIEKSGASESIFTVSIFIFIKA